MSKFKVGDRVELTYPTPEYYKQKTGDRGIVTALFGIGASVRWDNGRSDPRWNLEWLRVLPAEEMPDPTDYRGYYDAITEHSLPPAEPQDQ